MHPRKGRLYCCSAWNTLSKIGRKSANYLSKEWKYNSIWLYSLRACMEQYYNSTINIVIIYIYIYIYITLRARAHAPFSLPLSLPPPYCYFTCRSSRYNKVLFYICKLKIFADNLEFEIKIQYVQQWINFFFINHS